MDNIELTINKIKKAKNLVELHLHLDGAISLANCRELARVQNISLPKDDYEIIQKMRVSENCHNLGDALTKFDFALSLLQTKIGITTSIKNLQNELMEQGLIYAEIRFAPQLSTKKGLTQEQVIKAAIEGLNASELKSNLILCCMRGNDNYDANIETIRLAKKYLGNGVCAIDLAGNEGMYPTEDYKNLFVLAKTLNVPFTIHAGEAYGPSSVESAISFGTKRIGHGVRAFEDKRLLDTILKEGITLEICPTSNICTGIYSKVNEMPIKEFLAKKINITINTDDPMVFNTNLKKELILLVENFNLSYQDIINLQLNAIKASFLSQEEKNKIITIYMK